jgi:hypothetical protein
MKMMLNLVKTQKELSSSVKQKRRRKSQASLLNMNLNHLKLSVQIVEDYMVQLQSHQSLFHFLPLSILKQILEITKVLLNMNL